MSYAVLGRSIAGIAAALVLAESGAPVYLIGLGLHETGNLGDDHVIGPTPIHRAPISSAVFQKRASALLAQAGIQVAAVDYVALDTDRANLDRSDDGLRFRDPNDNPVSARAAIFAPNGTQPEPPRALMRVDSLRGRGISTSADADAEFYAGRSVAVVGCGPHAIAQACILASRASEVMVLCCHPAIRSTRWLDDARTRFSNLTLLNNSRIQSVLATPDHRVSGLLVQRQAAVFRLGVAGVFLAREPVVTWDFWGGQDRAHAFICGHRLYLAGLANGVDHADHDQLFEDGIRAARACLADRL